MPNRIGYHCARASLEKLSRGSNGLCVYNTEAVEPAVMHALATATNSTTVRCRLPHHLWLLPVLSNGRHMAWCDRACGHMA
eukprot:357415-Chlamydomonas_euryale.AAC.10